MHKTLGSIVTGTAGAWFVALGELDMDPVWSLVKKVVVIVIGGLLAGITHHIGAKLAVASLESGWSLFGRLLSVVRRPKPTPPPPPK